MRRALLTTLLVALAGPAFAQDTTITIRPRRDQAELRTRQLPRDVAEDVIRLFNAPGTLHFSGPTRVPTARGIDGDVAVLGGPVTLAGRVSGALVVVNGDLFLEPGAMIGGDVIVVGGTVEGIPDAEIAGEIRAYRETLRFRRVGEELEYAPGREQFPPWTTGRRAREQTGRSRSDFFLALGGTYNRVEGAPIVFGPRTDTYLSDGMRFQADLFGIVRSGRNFSLDEGDFGYRVRGELVFGSRTSNLGLGARAYDLINSVEPWPLKDYEAGWSAFLLHRDYRDLYRRRGTSLFASLRPTTVTSLTVEGREERHYTVDARDPWTLFRSDALWRANPAISDGRYRSALVSARYDTRNDRREPTSGVFLSAEMEFGEGRDITGTVDPFLVCIMAPCHPPELADGRLTYRKLFLDARTYLRVAPSARLHLRAAGGGRMGGEPLPLQRRVSLGYPDPMPGYTFRQFSCRGNNFSGSPALCDRVMVFQAEYRTHLGFDFGPDWANDWGDTNDDYRPFHVSGPDIVVFADAGRAWSVGNLPDHLPSDKLPALRSLRADVGLGLDFGPIGLYLAKALGPDVSGATFTVRMGRRF